MGQSVRCPDVHIEILLTALEAELAFDNVIHNLVILACVGVVNKV